MHLAALFAQHVSPAMAAAGFAIALVLSLVAAEEIDVRRGRGSHGGEMQA